MNIPYVIDNDKHKLADILNRLLHHFTGCSLDIATAYFTLSGFTLFCISLARRRTLKECQALPSTEFGLQTLNQ